MSTRDEITREALALPPDDRAFLADILEQSLAREVTSEQVSLAWTRELDRRIDAYERGEIEALDAESAIHEMRRELDERRSGTTN